MTMEGEQMALSLPIFFFVSWKEIDYFTVIFSGYGSGKKLLNYLLGKTVCVSTFKFF